MWRSVQIVAMVFAKVGKINTVVQKIANSF